MTKEYEEQLYDRLTDLEVELMHIQAALYNNDNERADKNSKKLFEVILVVREVADDYAGFVEDLEKGEEI